MIRKITEKLRAWKKRTQVRMPILINGARQVGKTFAIMEFGREHYKNMVYVNFEMDSGIASYFENSISPEAIIRVLEQYYHVKIEPEETLIFFDEIQACERALTALKYFTELAPQYHVAAAGSLLGVAVNREKYSFPVGKVYMETMYPLDFEEFLWAKDQELLSVTIRERYIANQALHTNLHNQAMNLYREYMIVGGMPAVVKSHISTVSQFETEEIKALILSAYTSDMSKYASHSESVKIRSAYDSIPAQLAKENKKFQYKMIKSGARSSLFGESIDWLIHAGLVLKCTKCEHGYMPPKAYQDLASFKLYMSDLGLLTTRTGMTLSSYEHTESRHYSGAMTENYVACALASNGYELMYWESENKAEVDFLIVKEGAVIPIEVKANLNNKSKSLMIYQSKYEPKEMIRISGKNFGLENGIQSVPLYAVFCI